MSKKDKTSKKSKDLTAIDRPTQRPEKFKSTLTTRLNKIEGQVRGIKGMIENDKYCDDVLTQISAIQSALDSVSKLVLENHIKGCLVKRIKDDDETVVDELLFTFGKLL